MNQVEFQEWIKNGVRKRRIKAPLMNMMKYVLMRLKI